MESYEQAVNLALMVVDLDKSVYQTMIRGGLKQYLNSQYAIISKTNNKNEINKFVLASKILLNDLQSIPVNSCAGRSCSYNCMVNNCDKNVDYKTPVFQEAIIDPYNVTNSQVTRYIDGFNNNTFNPTISRMTQPLDTIGLYHDNSNQSINNFSRISGYGPEAKVMMTENFNSPNSNIISDGKNTLYNQYSSIYVNNNGNGYYKNNLIHQVNNEKPSIESQSYKIINNMLH